MPARTAALMPSAPWACAATVRPALWASSTAGAQLVVAELLRARLDARRHHAARGNELDAVGARLELLADGLAHVVWPVGLAADPCAVAAGHADGQVGGDDARPFDEARGLRVAQRRIGPWPAAERRHRGEARARACCARGSPRASSQRVRLLHLGQPVRATAHREVDVAVDQTGQQRGVGRIDARRAGLLRGSLDATSTMRSSSTRTQASSSSASRSAAVKTLPSVNQ